MEKVIEQPLFSANWKRYTPWIAKVVKFEGKEQELEFGKIRQRDGETLFCVCAEPGDVVYYGIKDNRQCYHQRAWGVVTEEYKIKKCDKREARKYFQNKVLIKQIKEAASGN
jgi:hypothetical protein